MPLRHRSPQPLSANLFSITSSGSGEPARSMPPRYSSKGSVGLLGIRPSSANVWVTGAAGFIAVGTVFQYGSGPAVLHEIGLKLSNAPPAPAAHARLAARIIPINRSNR